MAASLPALKRRRLAQNASAFRLATADPATGLADDGFVMLASARMAFSLSEDFEAGDITVSVGSRTIGNAGGAADAVVSLGYFERGQKIEFNNVSAPAGDLTLYVLDQWNRPKAVATGSFS